MFRFQVSDIVLERVSFIQYRPDEMIKKLFESNSVACILSLSILSISLSLPLLPSLSLSLYGYMDLKKMYKNKIKILSLFACVSTKIKRSVKYKIK